LKGNKFKKLVTLKLGAEDISIGRFKASNGEMCDGLTALSVDGGLYAYNFHDKELSEVGSRPKEERELVTAVNSEMAN